MTPATVRAATAFFWLDHHRAVDGDGDPAFEPVSPEDLADREYVETLLTCARMDRADLLCKSFAETAESERWWPSFKQSGLVCLRSWL